VPHTDGWYPSRNKATHPVPGVSRALTAAPKRPVPMPDHLRPEGLHRVDVTGHGEVGEVTLQHASYPLALVGDGLIPASTLGYRRLERPRRVPGEV
jgi:hypothetical protein